MYYYWNWKEAEKNFTHALQINPDSSMIHIDYSILLNVIGRNEEAISEAKLAQELDPLSAYINTKTGDAFAYSGQIDRAIEEYRMCLTVNPNYYLTHFMLGFAYLVKGMDEEAFDEYKKAYDLSDGKTTALTGLICQYYRMGQTDQAEKLFNSLKKRS
jgi:tetratricopeptide (TPR) repeat protein